MRLAVQRRFGRHHIQAHLGIGGAANQLHHIINAPANDIFHLAADTLAHAHDAIAGLEPTAACRRATGHHFPHHHHIVLTEQHRTNALQRVRHLHVEVFRAARIHVVGMRINAAGVGIHEALKHFIALQLLHAGQQVGVTLVQCLANLISRLAGQLQAQPVVLHRLPPQRIETRSIGPWRILAVVSIAFVLAEIEISLELFARKTDPLVHTASIHIENRPCRIYLTTLDRIVQRGGVFTETGHVLCGQKHLARIQCLQIFGQDFARERIVQRPRAIGVTAVGQQAIHHPRGGGLVFGGGRGQGDIATASQQRQRRGQCQTKGQGEQGAIALHRNSTAWGRMGVVVRMNAVVTAHQC